MAGKAGLKAGLIGAAILFVVTLLAQVPNLISSDAATYLGCACCGVELLAYAGIGVLAGFFLTPPRNAGSGAGAGAIAGVMSGLVSGVLGMIISAIRLAVAKDQMIATIDPQQLRALIDAGIDPDWFIGWRGLGIFGSISCLCALAFGAALGAIGGAIFAAAKSD